MLAHDAAVQAMQYTHGAASIGCAEADVVHPVLCHFLLPYPSARHEAMLPRNLPPTWILYLGTYAGNPWPLCTYNDMFGVAHPTARQ